MINEDISVNFGFNIVFSFFWDCICIRFFVVVIYWSCIVSRLIFFIVDIKGFVVKFFGFFLVVFNYSFSIGYIFDIFVESLG